MSWHYQVRKRVIKGQVIFDIVEVYTDRLGWTRDSIAPYGESKAEVIQVLEMMLKDAKHYRTLVDRNPDA